VQHDSSMSHELLAMGSAVKGTYTMACRSHHLSEPGHTHLIDLKLLALGDVVRVLPNGKGQGDGDLTACRCTSQEPCASGAPEPCCS
jgi:hypothetical protein